MRGPKTPCCDIKQVSPWINQQWEDRDRGKRGDGIKRTFLHVGVANMDEIIMFCKRPPFAAETDVLSLCLKCQKYANYFLPYFQNPIMLKKCIINIYIFFLNSAELETTDSSHVYDRLKSVSLTTFLTTSEIGAFATQAIPSLIITKSSRTAGERVEEIGLKEKKFDWTSCRGWEAPRRSVATRALQMKSGWSGACVEDESAGSRYLSDVNRERQPASFTSKQATSHRFLWQENWIIKADGDVRLLLLARPSSVCYLSKCRMGVSSSKVPADKWSNINHHLAAFCSQEQSIHPFPYYQGQRSLGERLEPPDGPGHTLLTLCLWLGSSVVSDDFKVLNYSKFLWKTSWKDFTTRLLLTLSDWYSISEHLFCSVLPARCLSAVRSRGSAGISQPDLFSRQSQGTSLPFS